MKRGGNVSRNDIETPPESESESDTEADTENTDLDCLPQNRKKRDSAAGAYPRLTARLRNYRYEPGVFEDYPSERMVREIMTVAGGASEDEVIECLRALYEDRRLTPQNQDGPHRWARFKTVVPNYLEQQRARSLPPAAVSTFDRKEFEEMTEFMELPEGGE